VWIYVIPPFAAGALAALVSSIQHGEARQREPVEPPADLQPEPVQG
jgi:hypothetical protein